MKCLVALILFVSLASCVNVAKNENIPHEFTSVKIEPVYEANVSIRALKVTDDHIFFTGNHGKFGYLNTADHSIAYLGTIKDTIVPEFRALARTAEDDFIISVGNPALLYKVNFFGKRKLMYKETCDKVFYDALAFWNEDEGIAIGDPTENCMSFLITRDGGETWKKTPCENLPEAADGETAFAASNSNIAIVGEKTWVLSGGKKSRVYYSPNKGKTWQVFETPIIQGQPTQGGYSIDFYDENNGVIIGGDYTKPTVNTANKAFTNNGGETWNLLAPNEGPGYKSCIKYVPNSGGKEMVAIGFTGISYSNDYGKNWKQISEEPFYTLQFMNEFVAYAAGNNRIARLTFMENDPRN